MPIVKIEGRRDEVPVYDAERMVLHTPSGERVKFTLRENRLFEMLWVARGATVRHRTIWLALWPSYRDDDASLGTRVIVAALRRKLGQDAILSNRQVGYMLGVPEWVVECPTCHRAS